MFISEQKIYQLDLSKDSQIFLSATKEKQSGLHTLVFLQDFSDEKEKELLLKILSAVQLTNDYYVLIDKSTYSDIKLHHFISEGFSISHVLSFGLKAKSIGLNINELLYKGIKIDSLHILFSDGLKELQQQTNLKKALWNSLKQLYQVD